MIQEQERMRIAINRNGRTPYRHELKTMKTTKKKKPRQNDNNNAKIIKKQKENQHFRAWKKFQKKNHLNSEKRRIDKQHLVAAAAAPLDELPGNKQSIALSNLFSTFSAISIALCAAPAPPPPPPLKILLWVLGDFWNKIFRVSKTKSLGFLAKCRKFLWLGALLANLKDKFCGQDVWVENLNSKIVVLLSDLGTKSLGFLEPHFRVFGNCRVLGRFFVAYFSWQLDNMELKTNFLDLYGLKLWFKNS